jgi:hypothetical protein
MHHVKKEEIVLQTIFNIILIDTSFLTSQKIHHQSRHNPHPKNHIPQISHNITMKEIIQRFPTLFTHTTPIYYYDVTRAKAIQGEDFPKRSCPSGKKKRKEKESMLGRRTL